MLSIRGTFIDEISHDIPSANWGPREWALDFKAMADIGIDTVILIRAGYRNKVTFDSKTIAKATGSIMPVPYDLVDLFLDLAQRHGMKLFLGTYDSGEYWLQGQFKKEIEINKAFCEEVISRYGHRKAFSGWYITHEIDTYNPEVMHVYEQLASFLKNLKKIPTLISPYIHGSKQFMDNPITLDEHVRSWREVFDRIEGLIDIVAFQDGQVHFEELGDYVAANLEMAHTHGISCWSNVETFSRDMPIKFPPIGWPELLYKIKIASECGVENLITFEFSHFMSPNSIYPAAHNLYNRYSEWLGQNSAKSSKIIGLPAPSVKKVALTQNVRNAN